MSAAMKTDLPAASCDLKATGEFIASYAARLLGCGATCIRLRRNVDRISEAWGVVTVMTILPRHIHVTVRRPDCPDCFTTMADTVKSGISFNINTQLSELSWAIADRKIDFAEAQTRFDEICATRPEGAMTVLLLASLANAAFCRLFGGDIVAVAIVFGSTLAGYLLKQVMLEHKIDLRVVFMACAFVSSVLAAADGLFSLGSTPATAIGTSVLYLVPGIPFINSFSDMITGNYICSFCRFADAVILTACLSIGLCGGMVMMGAGMF